MDKTLIILAIILLIIFIGVVYVYSMDRKAELKDCSTTQQECYVNFGFVGIIPIYAPECICKNETSK